MTDKGSCWISGQRWQEKSSDDSYALAVSQRYGVSEIIGRLLYQRQIPLDYVESYLAPSIREFLPDPFHLNGMTQAVDRLAVAVESGEVIGIFGDYDVDGATSSAILIRYLRSCGITAPVHIPDRKKEGYGPNIYGFNCLKEQAANLIVTVDTGALAHNVLAEAKELGFEVIVLDHHQGEAQLPPAISVVNPNRFDEETEFKYLAAVGVTFLTIVGVHKRLRESGFFNDKEEPNLLSLLDIVALGTICDVVPLLGLNRAFVRQGLKVMAQKNNAGIACLLDVADIKEQPSTYHLGFVVGPRINAGGRVGKSNLGVKLLTIDNFEQAYEISEQLDEYNKERRSIEAHVQEQAIVQAEEQIAAGESSMIFAVGEGWHEGVIGIVAGRLKEKYGMPAAVISLDADNANNGKASARSVSGVDMGQMVLAARSLGLLEAGGGHAMAAGFSVINDKRSEFIEFARAHLSASVAEYKKSYMREYSVNIPISAATIELCDSIETVGPFGAGNSAPRIMIDNVEIIKIDVIGKTKEHLRLIVSEPKNTVGRSNISLKVMSFGTAMEDFGLKLLAARGKTVSLIGRLKKEEWQGRVSVSLMLEDAMFSNS